MLANITSHCAAGVCTGCGERTEHRQWRMKRGNRRSAACGRISEAISRKCPDWRPRQCRESAGTTVGRSEWPRSKLGVSAVRQRRNFGHRSRDIRSPPFFDKKKNGFPGASLLHRNGRLFAFYYSFSSCSGVSMSMSWAGETSIKSSSSSWARITDRPP